MQALSLVDATNPSITYLGEDHDGRVRRQPRFR